MFEETPMIPEQPPAGPPPPPETPPPAPAETVTETFSSASEAGTQPAPESPDVKTASSEKPANLPTEPRAAKLPDIPESHEEILGIRPGASPEEIKSAYRRRAQLYHPDRNPGNIRDANELMTKLTEARDTLLDPERRAIEGAKARDVEIRTSRVKEEALAAERQRAQTLTSYLYSSESLLWKHKFEFGERESSEYGTMLQNRVDGFKKELEGILKPDEYQTLMKNFEAASVISKKMWVKTGLDLTKRQIEDMESKVARARRSVGKRLNFATPKKLEQENLQRDLQEQELQLAALQERKATLEKILQEQ